MATYLVTGGCGFIGSHLVDALLSYGHSVRVLDNLSTGRRENIPDGADLIEGDVTDVQLVEHVMTGIDGCFHLAAIASVSQSTTAWLATHKVNLGGTITVFDQAAKRGGIPVVYASSAAVYGDNDAAPLQEATELRPISPYGADKLACELHARAAARVHGLPSVGLRFFNVFGPRQRSSSSYSGVISIFAAKLLAEEPITIFGDGEQTRDFVHCRDAVGALMTAMHTALPGAPVVNVCTGHPVSINRLVGTLARVMEVSPKVRYAESRLGDIRVSYGDPTLARRLLNWSGAVSLEAGLATLLV